MTNYLDLVGVPEFFAPALGAIEDAGHGLLRVVRCIERHGGLIPVYSNVIPIEEMLRQSDQARDFCEFMLKKRCSNSH
jgi:hypothetical protein